MRRVFWLAVGVTAGALVARRLTRAAEALTPRGIAASFGGLGDDIRLFADDVRAGMAEREQQLWYALGEEDSQGEQIRRNDVPAGGGR